MEALRAEFAGGRSCRLVLGAGALAALPAEWPRRCRSAALIGDETVQALFGERVLAALAGVASRVERLSFPPGERSKTRATKQRLEDAMLDAGLGRDCCVLALGGGVSLDLAGFVAATYQRGLEWLALPTSLLAQVDASVGGKTGVNTTHGKNLVGAVHQPAAVLIDPSWPASLPPEEWRHGVVELIKHGFIGDAALFERLERAREGLGVPAPLEPELVARSLRLKLAIAARDELERGERAWLNFGHTLGHALERASGFAIGHGRAVALGMIVEGRLAVRRAGLEPAALARLERLLAGLGLAARPELAFPEIAAHLRADKKNRAGEIRVALPSAPGRMARWGDEFTCAVSAEEVRQAWETPSASA